MIVPDEPRVYAPSYLGRLPSSSTMSKSTSASLPRQTQQEVCHSGRKAYEQPSSDKQCTCSRCGLRCLCVRRRSRQARSLYCELPACFTMSCQLWHRKNLPTCACRLTKTGMALSPPLTSSLRDCCARSQRHPCHRIGRNMLLHCQVGFVVRLHRWWRPFCI